MTAPAARSRRRGGWFADRRNGTGTYRWVGPNGVPGLYTGEWRNDMRNGLGTEVFETQNARIDGNFVNDRPQGPVAYTTNGTRLEGEILDGCLRTGGRALRIIVGSTGECR